MSKLPKYECRLYLKEAGSYYNASPIKNKDDAIEVIKRELIDLDREEVVAVNLDNKLKPINATVVSQGSVNGSLIPVPNVFKPALLSNVTGILLFHNHPSGDCEPSQDDMIATKRMIQAGKILEINIIDHIIIGGESGNVYSFKDHSLMDTLANV